MLAAIVALPEPAAAYIGPGAGLTAIGSVLAFLAAVVLLVAGVVWYPVKRLLRRRRGDAGAGGSPDVPHD